MTRQKAEKATPRSLAYLVNFRIRIAQRAMDLGHDNEALVQTRRAGQYVRVLASMTSDPDTQVRCESLDELLRDAYEGQRLGDEAAEDYLDFALAEAGVTLRSLS